MKFILGCISPIKPFAIVNRNETAALCGLVVFDVLLALEHFFIDISQLWKEGVLIQFFNLTIIPLVYRLVHLFICFLNKNLFL